MVNRLKCVEKRSPMCKKSLNQLIALCLSHQKNCEKCPFNFCIEDELVDLSNLGDNKSFKGVD